MSESPFKSATILFRFYCPKKNRSNPTHTISESHQFESNRLTLHRLIGTLGLRRGDVREHDCRHDRVFNGLRKDTESGVDPQPAATHVPVIQLSHADDESRHYGAYGDIRQKVQDEQHGIVRRKAAFEQRQIDTVKHMPSDSGG